MSARVYVDPLRWWPVHCELRTREWDCGARPYAARAAVQPGPKVRWEFGPDASPRDTDVDRLVRESAGTIDLRPRPEGLPLFANVTSEGR